MKILTMSMLAQREAAAFGRIAGMQELLCAGPNAADQLKGQFPDAAFALMVANSLSLGDREQNELHQRAYLSILSGEPISNVRYRYERDRAQYMIAHNWD